MSRITNLAKTCQAINVFSKNEVEQRNAEKSIGSSLFVTEPSSGDQPWLRYMLLAIHVACTFLGVVIITRYVEGQEALIFLACIALYALLNGYFISSVRSAAHFSSFCSVALGFFYLAYYLKILVILVHPDFCFPTRWYQHSPLHAMDVQGWTDVFCIFVFSILCFLLGTWFPSDVFLSRLRRRTKATKRQIPRHREVARNLILVGMGALLFRLFVTWGLGLGKMGQYQGEAIFGIPNLVGVLVLGSEWIGLTLLAGALVASIQAQSSRMCRLSGLLLLLFGVVPAMKTSSKATLLIPCVVIGLTVLAFRDRLRKGTKAALFALGVISFVLTLSFYDVLQQYRYVSSDCGFVQFLSENSGVIGFNDSPSKLLMRFVGIEGLATCYSYNEMTSDSYMSRMRSDFSYTHDVWGVPESGQFGMSLGILGVFLIFGGKPLVFAGSMFLGCVCRILDTAMSGTREDAVVPTTAKIVLILTLCFCLMNGVTTIMIKTWFCVFMGLGALRFFNSCASTSSVIIPERNGRQFSFFCKTGK